MAPEQDQPGRQRAQLEVDPGGHLGDVGERLVGRRDVVSGELHRVDGDVSAL
jgi:hypothetical protein